MNAGGNCEPSRMTQCADKIQQQEKSVNELRAVVDRLMERLDSVLMPPEPQVQGEEKMKTDQPLVALAHAVSQNTAVIRSSILGIESILRRLEN